MDIMTKGNPLKLVQPFDSDGVQCGLGQAKQYSFLMFQGLQEQTENQTFVCVESCENYQNCLKNSRIQSCNEIQSYQSVKFLNICLPLKTDLYQKIEHLFNYQKFQMYLNDAYQPWQIYITVSFAIFLVSYIFMYVLRYCTSIVIWTMLFSIVSASIGFGVQSYQNPDMQLLGVVLIGLGVIVLGCILFLYKKIKLTIAVTKASAQYTKNNPISLIVPILQGFLILGVFLFFGTGIAYIVSQGEIKSSSISPFGRITWDVEMRNNVLIFLFALIWCYEIVQALSSFILSYSSTLWYQGQQNIHSSAHFGICKSFYCCFRYHLGSIIFGSLILSLFETIQIIFNSVYKKVNIQGSFYEQNKIANCFLKCTQQCFVVFNKFLQYVNYHTYIMIAIEGENFVFSSKKMVDLISKNSRQFFVQQGMGFGLQIIGRFSIGMIGCLIGKYLLNQQEFQENFNLYIPLAVIFVISFLIGSCFMSIFGTVGDSLLVNILLDKQEEDSYQVPQSLQIFEENYM